eukprot:02670.XXX_61659_61927_1 [CDS] Oithona nana genome sequencing.
MSIESFKQSIGTMHFKLQTSERSRSTTLDTDQDHKSEPYYEKENSSRTYMRCIRYATYLRRRTMKTTTTSKYWILS